MVNLVALDSQSHRRLRVIPRPTGEYAEINVVSVIPRELPRLVAHYPIFFSKSAATGQFEPAALLGFERRENLYLVNDRWDVDYVPLQIQRQPFALLPRPGDGSSGSPPALDVAIDLSSPRIQTQDGEPLFGDDGRPSKYLEGITSILRALVSGSTEAFAFTGRLAELGLLETVRIDVEFVNGSQTKLEGVYWIAADAVKALTPPQLAELRDRGFLEWMYFQMASVAHMSGLVARKNRMLSGVTAARTPAGPNGDRG
jgi:hypothetical protein